MAGRQGGQDDREPRCGPRAAAEPGRDDAADQRADAPRGEERAGGGRAPEPGRGSRDPDLDGTEDHADREQDDHERPDRG